MNLTASGVGDFHPQNDNQVYFVKLWNIQLIVIVAVGSPGEEALMVILPCEEEALIMATH